MLAHRVTYNQYSPHVLCSGIDGTTCVQIWSVTINCDVTTTTHHETSRFKNHSLAVLHWDSSHFSSGHYGMRREGSTNIWWLIITCLAQWSHVKGVQQSSWPKCQQQHLENVTGKGSWNPLSGQNSQRNVHPSFTVITLIIDIFNCTTPHNPSPFYPSMSCSQKVCCDKNANDHQIPSRTFANMKAHCVSAHVLTGSH